MTTEGYRNKPQFKHNATLNKDITPNIPEFNSNALDNDGVMPLNNCCCDHEHKHEHKEDKHKCCHENHAENHGHKHCCCDHKDK